MAVTPETSSLADRLASDFGPAIERLVVAFEHLADAIDAESATAPYAPDLERLRSSVDRMASKAEWVAGLIVAGTVGTALDAATIRHDLRTPMSGVLGYAELLLEDMGDNDDRRFVAETTEVVTHAKNVLREITNLLAGIDDWQDQGAADDSYLAADAVGRLAASKPLPEVSDASDAIVGHILVVDDNEVIRDLVSRRLSKQGHTISSVASGEEAIAATAAADFDLIMLDLMMPGLSGDQVLLALKAQESTTGIPVIVMSALDETEAAVRCIQAGADDYLAKPLDPTLLKARIETLLERKFLRDRERLALALLKQEQHRSDTLLHNILPASVVTRLAGGEKVIADHFADVTVLFCDLVGFTALSSRLSPIQTLRLLNQIFSGFDSLAEQNGVEKIKTIGDAYLLVAGIPDPVSDPTWRVVQMARGMAGVLSTTEYAESLKLRIGISRGPAAAGVVGTRKLFYDVWGDTVNLASRLESICEPGRILVSEAVQASLSGRAEFGQSIDMELRGLGSVSTYYLQ